MGSGPVSAMDVSSYYEECSSHAPQPTQQAEGVYLPRIVQPLALRGFFSRKAVLLTLFRSYALMPASGDDYAGVTCVWCRSLLFRRRPFFLYPYLTFLYPTISSPPGFILTVVSPRGSPQLVRPYFLSVVEGAICALGFFRPRRETSEIGVQRSSFLYR